MRLAVLSHPCFRAANRRVYALLASRGLEVIIIAPARMGGNPPEPQEPGCPPVHFLPLSSENPRTYRFAGAEAVLEKFRPNAVLIDADPASRIAVGTGLWCKRHGARLACLTAENLDFGLIPHVKRVGLRSLPQAAAKTALHALARPLVDQVFTINRAGTELFTRHGYAHVAQVPLGFDPSHFRLDPAARQSIRAGLGMSDRTVVLGFFGRATQQKGLHHIVEALGRIEAGDRGRDWHFLLNEFQSDSLYTKQLRSQIEKAGIGPRISTFSSTHAEIGQYMAAADVAVLASLTQPVLVEQFGRVIPEAMACGALAVVSDSGAPKDLVGPHGIVFPEGDVDRLTTVLSDIIAHPERYRGMAAAGAAHARAHFSVERQAEIYYRQLFSIVFDDGHA